MRPLADNLPDEPTRAELEELIYQRAANDGAFWRRLASDPRAALAELFGKPVPSDLAVSVAVEDERTLYHVVPHEDAVELGVGPPVLYPRSNFRGQLNYLVHADAAFKQRFLADPKGAVAEAFGFRMPGHIEFRALQETADAIHLVLPWAPHGALFNSPFAIRFDGAGARVKANPSNSLLIFDALTVEAWVRPAAFGSQPWNCPVVSNLGKVDVPPPVRGWELQAGTGAPRFQIVVGNREYAIAGDPAAGQTLKIGEWAYLAAVFGNGTLSLYMNGRLLKSAPASGKISVWSGALLLGGSQYPNQPFNGDIDEVRVYGRALAPEEIARNRPRKRALAEPLGASDPNGPVVHYPMSEGNGATLIDHSGHGNDGALENGARWVGTGVESAPTA